MATEDSRNEADKESLYKTKVIQFLGRTTPIILQNDNGPCPLLAICNVLLLKNNLNLSTDVFEISLQKLLSLVAERLIDSNSNIENKDTEYVENQQQNIADAIDLLPRLATGIDVNIKFRRIDDFEFTRECAIFDLLDMPLYHGWIVDPQDFDTANAIGSKSYNTLTGELVALETRNTDGEHKINPEEDFIDFAAATTATLGVPSPCLSRGTSFDDSPCSVAGQQKTRKGDLEEEEELLRVLKLSNAESTTPVDESLSADTNGSNKSARSDENSHIKGSRSGLLSDTLEGHSGDEHLTFHQPEPTISQASQHCNASSSCNIDGISSETISKETDHSFFKIDAGDHPDLPSSKEREEPFISSDLMQNIRTDELAMNQSEPFVFSEGDSSSVCRDHMHGPGGDKQVQQTCLRDTSTSEIHLEPVDNRSACESIVFSGSSEPTADSDSIADTAYSGGRKQNIDVPERESVKLSFDGSEPIYEGEECILDSGLATYENREPIYEGEMVLAEQADRGSGDACDVHPKDEITEEAGDLIRNFLKNNASQLTIYGLFCLQEGLKERELCVFFRNNHFSTLFKFNGDLYLLATDQGYINQPDLVWEKFNEVNGDTVFMTGNFTEFKVENHANDAWDEQNAMATTADYLAGIDNSASSASTLNSDLQLAIALQQQEFENQPQRQNNSQQSSAAGGSRLVIGPQQVPRNSSNNSSNKQEATKSKDKCIVM